MDEQFEKRLAQRLEVLEELRVLLGSEGITCPGVVVVGEQSSGKSSVLERLTDIAFPRGTNTCTRVPIIVQLQKDSSKTTPVAQISLDESFNTNVLLCETKQDITDAIHDLMGRIVNSSASPVHDTPIHIKYIRSKGPVMTLIDLPGITRYDNLERDIHGPTTAMVHKYINDENMIVLVVLPAPSDFGNSDALDIARSCDVGGDRTIGVVTKCDLLPEKTNIIDVLRMKTKSDVRLRLGFIAVRNRGLQEEGIDIEHEEQDLFRKHPQLRRLEPHECGYEALREKIVSLQASSVDRAFPVIRGDINRKIELLKSEIRGMGKSLGSRSDRDAVLLEELIAIDGELRKLIRAEVTKDSGMYISARAMDLYEKFASDVKGTFPDCLSAEYTTKVKRYNQDVRGYALPNFANDLLFQRLIRELFFEDNLAPKTERLIEEVGELMCSTLLTLVKERESMKRLPKLATVFHEKIETLVSEAQEKAKTLTKEVLEAERVQVFALNDNYMKQVAEERARIHKQKKEEQKKAEERNRGGGGLIIGHDGSPAPENGRTLFAPVARGNTAEKASSNFGDDALLELQISLHCYGTVMMTRLFDVIPMLVNSCLVHSIQGDIHQRMRMSLEGEDWETLFQEDARVRSNRITLERRLSGMLDARRKFNRLSHQRED